MQMRASSQRRGEAARSVPDLPVVWGGEPHISNTMHYGWSSILFYLDLLFLALLLSSAADHSSQAQVLIWDACGADSCCAQRSWCSDRQTDRPSGWTMAFRPRGLKQTDWERDRPTVEGWQTDQETDRHGELWQIDWETDRPGGLRLWDRQTRT